MPTLPRRAARAVPAQHAFVWYADAMRLWKRGPATFCGIALVILVANIALNLVAFVGIVVAQLLLPLAECGLLYASLAADRGDRPRLRHVVAVAAAPPRALAAVIAASLVVFAAEALVANAIGGFNMLAPASNADSISGMALVATYATGIVVSLPVTFVPFAALFDGAGFRDAFAQSGAAFARNVAPLVLYGALSFALLMLGLATSGIGLLLALPWSAAASYAAWKDVFHVA
ncbi:MAG TPA: hypothetical protein VIF33_00185 [Casimicrobiaceae bacterium]|jgi:hypothetical protein